MITSDTTTGFGSNGASYGGRFVNKDGSANIQKKGLPYFERISWFHSMLNISTGNFLAILFIFYFAINLIFATIYFLIGTEHLNGIDTSSSAIVQFGKAFFFSTQTFTTVGYGHMSPDGFVTSSVAAAEALIGLLSFAIATGLFFGRFSKPTAFLKFSENALISPFKNQTALMIRLSPFKNTNFTEAIAKITLGIKTIENGVLVNKFYQLPLEMSEINSLTLSWTLVHPISENSPLFEFSENDFKTIEGEIIVYVKTFDDLFSATVVAKTSYTFTEFVYGAKFDLMYVENDTKTKTVLYLDKLNDYKKVSLP